MPVSTLLSAKTWTPRRIRTSSTDDEDASVKPGAAPKMPNQPQPKPSTAPAPSSRPSVAPLQPLTAAAAPRLSTSASSFAASHTRHQSSPSPSSHHPHPPMSQPTASRSRPTTPESLLHRQKVELQIVRRQTLELREEKAYLTAQNLRLTRELGRDPAFAASREADRDMLRPGFGRSISHPNADFPQGGLSSLSSVSAPPSAVPRPGTASPWSSARPRTPSAGSFTAVPARQPSFNAGHRQQSSTGSVPDYPFPLSSRRSSASGYAVAPDPASLSRPSSMRSVRSRTGSLASTSGRVTPASLASTTAVPSTPATAGSLRGRSQSRPNSAVGGSSDSLRGILKPPRSSSREPVLTGLRRPDMFELGPPPSAAAPRRRTSFDNGRLAPSRPTKY